MALNCPNDIGDVVTVWINKVRYNPAKESGGSFKPWQFYRPVETASGVNLRKRETTDSSITMNLHVNEEEGYELLKLIEGLECDYPIAILFSNCKRWKTFGWIFSEEGYMFNDGTYSVTMIPSISGDWDRQDVSAAFVRKYRRIKTP